MVVCDVRARLTTLVPFKVEHEVVVDKLTAALEEFGQGLLSVRALEDLLLLYLFPGQIF
jgi:hypothetical protein